MGELELGITTIGDLLLNNKITSIEGQEGSRSVLLTIPCYQRPYKWTVRNVLQLIDDIDDARIKDRDVYRVGTLILHHDGDCYNIVDGQQRTITFALILQCLQSLNLMEAQTIKLLDEDLSSNPYTTHNVLENYKAIKRRLTAGGNKNNKTDVKESHIDLPKFIRDKCELIVVITDDQTEAFQFFDSQNARGKALYPHDLLKAYHLREMSGLDHTETEQIVGQWEELDQSKLSKLLEQYLYRLKCWLRGNRAYELNEETLGMFKGITSRDNYPYARYYKSACLYARMMNRSASFYDAKFQPLPEFQINAPVIAGEPFFAYAQHYYKLLDDIQDNSRKRGFLIKGNAIIRTLDNDEHRERTGDKITRFLLDAAILFYVDRFCHEKPSDEEAAYLEKFVMYAFIWAYSLRAQYYNLGWLQAQNYVLGNRDLQNGFNLYKVIAEAVSPEDLFHQLANEKLKPLQSDRVKNRDYRKPTFEMDEEIPGKDPDSSYFRYYLHFFKANGFWEDRKDGGQ